MKVLFVETPPTISWTPESGLTTAGRRHPSLNVTGEKVYSYVNLSAAAVLRENGHNVKYIHCTADGKTVNDLKKVIPKIDPDVTVFHVEHINMGVDNKVSEEIKKDTSSKIVYVGPFATPLSNKFIKYPFVDFVVRGEWDYSLNNLVNCLDQNRDLSKIKGIIYKEGNKTRINKEQELIQNLDELPIPAYDLVDHRKFYEAVFKRFPTATTITSRGCPYKCIYCVFPNTIYSHKFRAQSPERVVEEVKYLYEEIGIREVRYDDDTFEIDRKRVFDICRKFKEEAVDMIWAPQCRPDNMSKDLVKEMKSAGCVRLLFGIESGSDEILNKIRKGTTTAKIKEGVRNAQKEKIEILNCVMIGFLWDTPETIKKTIDFAFDLNAEYTQFSMAIPLPGTDYYEILREKNYILSEKWEDMDSFFHTNVSFPHLSQADINNALKDVYRRYYLRPRYLGMMFKKMFRSKEDCAQIMRLTNAFVRRFRERWI